MSIEQSDIIAPADEQVSMSSNNSVYLSREETRKILTPFAFEIDKSLFGLPLAVPRKRAIALLIDFLIISLLVETPGELLALLAAMTFYTLGSNQFGSKKTVGSIKNKKRGIRSILLRFLAAIILLITILSYLSPAINNWYEGGTRLDSSQSGKQNFDVINTFALNAMTSSMTKEIADSQCENPECWSNLLSPLINDYVSFGTSSDQMTSIISQAVEKTSLSTSDQKALNASLINELSSLSNNSSIIDKSEVKDSQAIEEQLKTAIRNEPQQLKSEEKSITSQGFDWIKGVIDDLGLSFGWAALYFSVLTSIWHGQTPGKRLMKVRVIQLDGTPLSVWDSFGRYGGYGAGLATGLMGFLQIYWDANRQCIHDKIASTVVIDLKKLKQQKNIN